MAKLIKNIHFFIIALGLFNFYNLWLDKSEKIENNKSQTEALTNSIEIKKKNKKELQEFFRDIEEAKDRIERVAQEIEKAQQQLPAELNDGEIMGFITKKADELNNTPPEINLEKLIVQVLTRAISIVNDMLGVVKIPEKADARNWWAYLFAYRSMLFAIVRLYEPDKVAKNKNGAKVEPPDANILTKAWAYTKNTGKVLEMIESMLTLYHRKELARRTESNVALPRAYILLDAHKAVLEDQAMRPLENYHMSRK